MTSGVDAAESPLPPAGGLIPPGRSQPQVVRSQDQTGCGVGPFLFKRAPEWLKAALDELPAPCSLLQRKDTGKRPSQRRAWLGAGGLRVASEGSGLCCFIVSKRRVYGGLAWPPHSLTFAVLTVWGLPRPDRSLRFCAGPRLSCAQGLPA